MNSFSTVEKWISEDSFRMNCLQTVNQVLDGQWYVGAGFVRNLVWDKLHQYTSSTKLNDVDVIFCDWHECSESSELKIENSLRKLMPDVNWSAKNQIRMAKLHGHEPYKDCCDAMLYWPELETAVAATLTDDLSVQVISPFSAAKVMGLTVSRNAKCTSDVFSERYVKKNW